MTHIAILLLLVHPPKSTLQTGSAGAGALGVDEAEAAERGGAGGKRERPPLKASGWVAGGVSRWCCWDGTAFELTLDTAATFLPSRELLAVFFVADADDAALEDEDFLLGGNIL